MGRKTGEKIKNLCIFALPGCLIFCAVVILPFLSGFYLTLTDWDGVSKVKNIVGVQNYISVFKDTTFWSMVIVTVWQLSGYMMLIYIAGFTGLSTDVLEAASIDGATGFQKMKSIILPLMVPSFVICLFLTLSRAFMVYDVNLTLTGGEPYGSTKLVAMYVYEKAFTSRNYGVGQAEALILFIIVACISGAQIYIGKKKEVEA